ncbi:MAG TPA: hypothetical protein VHX65_14290 [Pirellulales bacterium]|nr:hypothetical protein [Pirellulales bacterium]
MQYVETILAPEIHRAGAGGESLRMTEHALRWLDALLKRAPTLADLSGFASSATMPAELVRFIVAHDRLPSTGKAMVGRLFALWKAVVWAGHMPPIGGPPKLPAVKRLKPRREGATPYGGIPTREAIERGRAVGQVAPTLPQVITAPATLETTLLSFLVDYYAMERPLAAASIDRGYGAAIQSFSRFLGRPATLADLVAPTVNAWIASRDGIGSPNTASSHRRQLLVLWRFAYETEVLNELPRRIRKVKTPRRVIEGWDTEQMGRLLAAADQLSGSFRKTRIERRLWWRAFLLTAWYTGLRLGDVLAIRFDSITQSPDGGGRLTVVMSKTGDTIDRVLPASAMQAILASMASSPRETCFPLWVDQRHFYRAAKALIHSAGLRGTIRWIRRGSASEAERIKAGAGRAHLGHRTVGLFESNYRVDRITQQEVILPPEPAFQPTLRLEHKIDANQAGEAKGGAH